MKSKTTLIEDVAVTINETSNRVEFWVEYPKHGLQQLIEARGFIEGTLSKKDLEDPDHYEELYNEALQVAHRHGFVLVGEDESEKQPEPEEELEEEPEDQLNLFDLAKQNEIDNLISYLNNILKSTQGRGEHRRTTVSFSTVKDKTVNVRLGTPDGEILDIKSNKVFTINTSKKHTDTIRVSPTMFLTVKHNYVDYQLTILEKPEDLAFHTPVKVTSISVPKGRTRFDDHFDPSHLHEIEILY